MANVAMQKIDVLYQSGLSAKEVDKKIGVSPWLVYRFMRANDLPRRTRGNTNNIRFERLPQSFQIKSRLSGAERELFVAGIMLYWAEGAKRGTGVDFANSDSDMIKIFLRFLRQILQVDRKRLRVYLYRYANQDINTLKHYWGKITRIPIAQFTRPYIREDFKKKNGREMKYGMVHIRYSDKKLLRFLNQAVETWVGGGVANRTSL